MGDPLDNVNLADFVESLAKGDKTDQAPFRETSSSTPLTLYTATQSTRVSTELASSSPFKSATDITPSVRLSSTLTAAFGTFFTEVRTAITALLTAITTEFTANPLLTTLALASFAYVLSSGLYIRNLFFGGFYGRRRRKKRNVGSFSNEGLLMSTLDEFVIVIKNLSLNYKKKFTSLDI